MALTFALGYDELLLNEQLTDSELRRLLAPVDFGDWQQAHRCLLYLAGTPEMREKLAANLPYLLLALSQAAHPDRVLVSFERFVQNAGDQAALLQYLADNPRAIEILVKLFAGSQFLTEIMLRHPHYFERVTKHKSLARRKDVTQLLAEARTKVEPYLTGDDSAPQIAEALDAVRRFQRAELLRIGTCDLLDLFDLPTVTAELSHLADSVVETCLTIAAMETGISPEDFAVFGMGKLGGGELNYSSDIDLIFLSAADGHTYRRLGQKLIDGLSRITSEGFLYRVDMRLRPWGRSGALVNSLEGHVRYLQEHAGLWEKQALLKARVIAGSQALGQQFLQQATPLIFSTNGDSIRADVRAMKDRIEAQLRQSGRNWGEVKLGEGSIRDIEFVTQYLQLAHTAQHPEIHCRNTLDALARLYAGGFISPQEYRVLVDGYIFLRTIEHHLQLMHYRQTHTLPGDKEALMYLAHRLSFDGPDAGEMFVARYQQHSTAIRVVYRHYLDPAEWGGHFMDEGPQLSNRNLTRSPITQHMTKMPSAYVTTFAEGDIEHHVELLKRLDDKNLVEVAVETLDKTRWRVTIVGHDYLGELSIICGLLLVYGFNIIDGHIFSYGRDGDQPMRTPAPQRSSARSGWKRRRRALGQKTKPASGGKIVDVFTVSSVYDALPEGHWTHYTADLEALSRRLRDREIQEAQGELAKRVADTLRELPDTTGKLYPVEIEIDNDSSERHSILRIEGTDTIGFLYELTNALALNGINIRRMTVASVGRRVHDTLYVTDARRAKITAPEKQRELRIATALTKHFTHLLPQSPNPEAALLHFHQFIGQLFMQQDWADEITSLEQPEVLDRLARLLGVSDFLWYDFLRMQHANLFPIVRDVEALASAKSKAELREALEIELQATPPGEPRRMKLNAFKDREMFRIDMRQIEGYITEFGQFSAELSDLAEIIVEAAYRLSAETVRATFGVPRLKNGRTCPMSVCALGKCGGRELGFASDIELMFIFAGNGRTSGPRVITTAEFYEKVVQEFNRIIQARREGIFEIDLQLRPYGKAGSMAVSLEAFQRYFGPGGDAWPYERQALIKLRPIAGQAKFGQELVRLRDKLIYDDEPFDVAAMRAMRERQLRHLVTAGTVNAKFSPGGLVDVEYLVQGLQIRHGHRNSKLRLTNTYEAMAALARAGHLSEAQYQALQNALAFLRRLINALRMVRGNAKDLTVPPPDSEEFAFLARRLNYDDNPGQLHEDLTLHTAAVQELNVALLG
jgi:glutamate-ammonia-ligase adenylyltransferase